MKPTIEHVSGQPGVIGVGHERRSFLKQVLAGGAVLALGSAVHANEPPSRPFACGDGSFIDALELHLRQISDFKSEVLLFLLAGLGRDLQACETTIRDLEKLVTDLEKEICGTAPSNPQSPVKEVIDLNRINLKLIHSVITDLSAPSRSAALEKLNQKIVESINACIPNGPVTLTPKATEILKNILVLIRKRAVTIPSDVDNAQTRHSLRVESVNNSFRKCVGHIESAINNLLAVEPPRAVPDPNATNGAIRELGQAILRLNDLSKDSELHAEFGSRLPGAAFVPLPARQLDAPIDQVGRAFGPRPDPPARTSTADELREMDFHIIYLEGIRRGIAQKFGGSITQHQGRDGKFTTVSYSASAARQTANEHVGVLLQRHGLAATPARIATVIGLVQFAYGTVGWLLFEWMQVIMIRRSLRSFRIRPKSDRTPPSYDPSLDKLAQGLAEIF